MFNKSKNKETAPEKKLSSRNVISAGTKIVGDLISQGDFRIDGTLEGTLKTDGRVIIGKDGFIKGNIECKNADVEGKFSGEFLVADTLTAKSTSNITGNVSVGQISTESGATFNATCNMKGAVKELSAPDNASKKQLNQKTA